MGTKKMSGRGLLLVLPLVASVRADLWASLLGSPQDPEGVLVTQAVDHISLLSEFCTVQGGKNCPQVVGGSSAEAGYASVAGVTDCANCSAAWDNGNITIDSVTTGGGRFSSKYTPDKCCNLTNEFTADMPSQVGVPSTCKGVKKQPESDGSNNDESSAKATYEYSGDCPKVGALVAYMCAAPNEVCCAKGGKTFKAYMSANHHCCAVDTYAHYECPDGYECGDINGDKEQIKCMPAESSGASATFAVTSVVAASTVLAMLAPAFA